MAIRAPHVALLNFGNDRRHAVRTPNSVANIEELGRPIPMIEFENDGICLTAVHARMSREIRRKNLAKAVTLPL